MKAVGNNGELGVGGKFHFEKYTYKDQHPPKKYNAPSALTVFPEGGNRGGSPADPDGKFDPIQECLWNNTKSIFDNAAISIWFYGDFLRKTPFQNKHGWNSYERIPVKNRKITWQFDKFTKLSYPLLSGVRIASLHMHSKLLNKVRSTKEKYKK